MSNRTQARERTDDVSQIHEPDHVAYRHVQKLDRRYRQQLRKLRVYKFDGTRLDLQRSAANTVQSSRYVQSFTQSQYLY